MTATNAAMNAGLSGAELAQYSAAQRLAPAPRRAALATPRDHRRGLHNDTRAALAANSTLAEVRSSHGSSARMRWLMATALPCADRAAVSEVRGFITAYASPRMHVRANLFDAALPEPRMAACTTELVSGAAPSMVSVSRVAGHKTLFWRRELTPATVARYDLVWLLDCDVRALTPTSPSPSPSPELRRSTATCASRLASSLTLAPPHLPYTSPPVAGAHLASPALFA
jgi:hypothetical protein